MPDGPFWLLNEHQFIQINISKGHIIPKDVILADTKSRTAVIGNLENNTYLTNTREIMNIMFEQSSCLNLIKLSSVNETIKRDKPNIRLPLKVYSLFDEHRIMIRPSKILNFNRVAKTGSVGIAHLLADLGLRLDFNVRDISANGEDLEGVQM